MECACPPGVASRSSVSRPFRTPRSVSTARLVPNDAASERAHSEPGSIRPTRRPLLILGLVVGVVLLDQITKAWVVASLADGPLSIIGDTVELRLVRHPGGAVSNLTAY